MDTYHAICGDEPSKNHVTCFRAVLDYPGYTWTLGREKALVATLMELAGCGILDLAKIGLSGLVSPAIPKFTAIVPVTPIPEAKRLCLRSASMVDLTPLPMPASPTDLGTKVPPWAGADMSIEVAAVVEHLLLSCSELAKLESREKRPRKEWEKEVWWSTTDALIDCVLVSPLFSVTANQEGLTPSDLATCVDHFDRQKGLNTRASANRTAMAATIAAVKASFVAGLPAQVQALFTSNRTIMNWFRITEEAKAYDDEEADSSASRMDCGQLYVRGVDYWGLGEARDFPCALAKRKEKWKALRLQRGRPLATKQERSLVRVRRNNHPS